MDRNALLLATRTEFLLAFQGAVEHALALATTAAFRKADFSLSHAEQRLLQDAHRLLQDRLPELKTLFKRQMEQLVNRSFQTTYSTFRPSFSTDFTSDTLTLIESTHLEDQLRIDKITTRFRNAAEQELRDLNIRVALLFEQDTINERENPFRPWLLSRCITNAVQSVSNRAALSAALSDQITDALEPSAGSLYKHLNSFLAKNGISAQLQLKTRHPLGARTPLAGGRAAEGRSETHIDAAALPQVPSANVACSPGAIAQGSPRFVPIGEKAQSPAGVVHIQVPADPAPRACTAAVSRLWISRLVVAVRQLAETRVTAGSLRSGARLNTANPIDAPYVPAEAFKPDPVGFAQHLHADRSTNGWLESPGGPAVTLHRFFAGETALATYGTMAPDARIVPCLDTRVDRSLGPLLAESLQTFLDHPAPEPPETEATAGAINSEWSPMNQILQRRSVLTGATSDVSEQMTIDVMAMLFEFILWDCQTPARVRAQLARIQFLALRIALRESTLLTQRVHPLRVLVNRIGEVAVGLQKPDLQGIRISQEIVRIVGVVLSRNAESSAPFLAMEREFDASISAAICNGDANIQRAVQLTESARSRMRRFTYVAAQLEEALFGLNIDTYLRRFMLSDWVQVIARAEWAVAGGAGGHMYRTNDACVTSAVAAATTGVEPTGSVQNAVSNAMRYRLLVVDLLWSIVPHADPESRTQLLKRLPGIVRTIREGLASIGLSAQQQQPILDWLVQAHRGVLHGSPASVPGSGLPYLRQHFDLFIKSAQPQPSVTVESSTSAAQRQAILDEVIRESDGHLAALDMAAVDTALAAWMSDRAVDIHAESRKDGLLLDNVPVQDRLHPGVLVELNLGTLTGAARLIWVDHECSLLVMTVEGQRVPFVLSMHTFRRLMEIGSVRFVSDLPLFERAIESVMQAGASLGNV
ncbi:MAG: hypothetical protein NVSMB6_03730 [Burkholderiaceae bacterium]